jgi:hypothetical protein
VEQDSALGRLASDSVLYLLLLFSHIAVSLPRLLSGCPLSFDCLFWLSIPSPQSTLIAFMAFSATSQFAITPMLVQFLALGMCM